MFPWSKAKPEPPAPAIFFPWTSELKIGVQRFDLEHQQMQALINQLHTLMVVKRDRPGADLLTDMLIQVTRTHFANEETLLAELNYPDCEAHAQEHSKLIVELRDLQRQFKAGTLSALAMPSFLKKWLVEHIQNTDRKYAAYVRAKGAS
jgi:hemerythrin